MLMSLRCGGDFTTNASVVDQISKRQDVCLVSFKKSYNSFSFRLRKLHRHDVFILKRFYSFCDKIAYEGEGHKPSSEREKYIVESEFALLGILSKQCIMIYFYFRFQ